MNEPRLDCCKPILRQAPSGKYLYHSAVCPSHANTKLTGPEVAEATGHPTAQPLARVIPIRRRPFTPEHRSPEYLRAHSDDADDVRGGGFA